MTWNTSQCRIVLVQSELLSLGICGAIGESAAEHKAVPTRGGQGFFQDVRVLAAQLCDTDWKCCLAKR